MPLPWPAWGHAVIRTLCAAACLTLGLDAHASFKPAATASAAQTKVAPRPAKPAPKLAPKLAHQAPSNAPTDAAPAARSGAQCADLTTQLSLGVEGLSPAQMRYLKEHCQLAASSQKHP